MAAALLGEPVKLADWTGPVLVRRMSEVAPKPQQPARPKRRPRKAARAPQQAGPLRQP